MSDAPSTKSGRTAPDRGSDVDWKEHKARRKAAKRAEKKWYSRPVAMGVTVAALGLSFVVASGFVGLIENGNQLPQAVQLAHINAQTDVMRSQDLLTDTDTATLVWSRSLDSSVIIVEGLAKLDDGSNYRVWFMAGDKATPAGELHVDHDGSEVWTVLTGDVAGAQKVLVTIDAPDATKPGGDVVAEIVI